MKEAAGCAGQNELLCKFLILQCVILTEKCFTWVKSDYKNNVKMELHPFCQKYGKNCSKKIIYIFYCSTGLH